MKEISEEPPDDIKDALKGECNFCEKCIISFDVVNGLNVHIQKQHCRAGVSCSTIRGKPATTSLCESMHKSSVVEVGESSCEFCEKGWKMAKTSATILKHNTMTKTCP